MYFRIAQMINLLRDWNQKLDASESARWEKASALKPPPS